MSTLNMIVGGVGFETLFGMDKSPADYVPIPYHVFNFLMWIAFLLLFPIIFRNLLVCCSFMTSGETFYPPLQTSLAVGDVLEVRRKAELRKLELQVHIVLLTHDTFMIILILGNDFC